MHTQIKKTVLITTIIVIVMFGFSFALAPLYTTFCRVAGIQRLPTENEFYAAIDATRNIQIQFITTTNQNIPCDFYPLKNNIIVHPGKNMRVLFFAKNNTKHVITVQAIPSIAPTLAVAHFHKIQCFCFEKQILNPGEAKTMPVIFRIDRELPADVQTITLAYTLFDVTAQQPIKRI